MLARRAAFVPRQARAFSARPTLLASRSTTFSRPGPPALPAAEQAEFESLVKAAQTSVPLSALEADAAAVAPGQASPIDSAAAALQHPDARRGPGVEFEGDTNPRTGEVGGPKRDPFVAGDKDWQYGGRVTDF
ncbi:hypothetical protein Q5752_006660 [Cryptotrichosporon argae]